uniref:Uncharacterized protein n=1 Tax=Sipha flava TaxID=143950 RepID=A0A2S2Q3B4_9HEMI
MGGFEEFKQTLPRIRSCLMFPGETSEEQRKRVWRKLFKTRKLLVCQTIVSLINGREFKKEKCSSVVLFCNRKREQIVSDGEKMIMKYMIGGTGRPSDTR